MDTLQKMRIFTRVAEHESYTRAADALGMPKANVSTAVKELEEKLKTRLFNRTTRKVQLTLEGEEFLSEARALIDNHDHLLGRYERGHRAIRGRIRVDMSIGLAKDSVIPFLPEFLELYPNLRVELSSTDRLVDVVGEGFDCVVRVGSRVDSGLIGKTLGEMPVLNCASAAYLEARGRPSSLEALASHLIVEFTPSMSSIPEGFEYVQRGRSKSLAMASVITVNNSDAYVAACLAGLGIIQVPSKGVRAFIESGELVEILPEFQAKPMPVTLLYPHKQFLPERVKVFMEWLEARLKSELRT